VSNDSGVTVRALVNNVTNEIGLTEGNARASVLGTGTVGNATVGRSIFGRNFTLSIEKAF
jgi:outer membrane receptor protein involved in Fe transport